MKTRHIASGAEKRKKTEKNEQGNSSATTTQGLKEGERESNEKDGRSNEE